MRIPVPPFGYNWCLERDSNPQNSIFEIDMYSTFHHQGVFYLVPLEGFEPSPLSGVDFKSTASAVSPQGHVLYMVGSLGL
jgi:hypothetical protein